MSTTAEKPTKTAAERAEEHAQKVASLLVEQLRKGTAPWQRPWELSAQSDVPTNATTGKPYRGSNYIYLWATQIEKGYADDNRWLTFNQAKSIGAQVRKGEHGTSICFPATHYETIKKDEAGKPVIGSDGKPEKIYVKYDQPRMKYYTVFHASQCDGMPPLPERKLLPDWERHQRAEAILTASGARISHGGNRAYYMPGLDFIQLPAREQFASADKYYATALHELGHWTGHADRLNRDGITGGHAFGSTGYAKEELRAEISSLMVGQELGIGHDPEQHAAYVKSWVQILQDDPKEILHACTDASKIQDYVLQYDLERARTNEHDHEQAREHPDAEPLPLARVAKWEVGVLDAACIANLDVDKKALETWGDEHPGIAVRDTQTQDRIWLRYEARSPEWSALTKAMRGIEPYEARVEALVRNGTALDERVPCDVQIGRNLLGNTIVQIMPVGISDKAVLLQVEIDDAHRFANAMEIDDSRDRRAYTEKLEHLRATHATHVAEIENEMEMDYER